MFRSLVIGIVLVGLLSGCQHRESRMSGNPLVAGWYADPELVIFDNQYWIYPTHSGNQTTGDNTAEFSSLQQQLRAEQGVYPPFLTQTFFDAFSSPDLVHWKKHHKVLEVKNIPWAAYALWAPSMIEANGQYYFFFSANNIQHNSQLGGIGVAISNKPQGPFIDALGKPLISQIHNGAQPIDQFVFRDDDGQHYIYYGGWGHCNVARLSADLLSVIPFADGEFYKEITPEHYVEGSFVIKRGGKYYLMWSEGDWTGPEYSVAYAIGDSPIGPFARIGKILQQDTRIAKGAGHHSLLKLPGTEEWYIAYHRRPLSSEEGNHRELAIERLYFDQAGFIKPVVMTHEGVAARPLPGR
jgi:beta-xylosidase